MSKLKKIREKADFTQEQLSQISEVAVEAIENYEKGNENINEAPIKILFSLSQALRCHLEELLETEKFRDTSKNKLCTGEEITAESLKSMVENHLEFAASGATKYEIDIARRVIYQGYDDCEEDLERLIEKLKTQHFDCNIDLKIISQIVGESHWKWMDDRKENGVYDVRYSNESDIKEKLLKFYSEFQKWLKNDPTIKSITIDCSGGYGQGFMSELIIFQYIKTFRSSDEMNLDIIIHRISNDEIALKIKSFVEKTQFFIYLFQKFAFEENEDFLRISCSGKRGDISIIFNYDDYAEEDISSLKKYREKAGLSQSQLAEKAGINIGTIQKYEQGDRDIRKAAAETVQKLSAALDCKMEDLIR